MSASGFILLVLAGAAASMATRPVRRLSLAIGTIGLAGAFVAALLVQPGSQPLAGGAVVDVTVYLRLLLAASAAVATIAMIAAIACGSAPRDLPAALLVTLAALAAGVGLAGGSIVGSTWSPAAAGALVLGAAAVVVAPMGLLDRVGRDLSAWRAAGRSFQLAAIATSLAVLGTALLAAAAADGSSGDSGPVAPATAAAALLLVAAAVAVRVGALPFHALSARHWETGSRPGVPILAAWAPAGLCLVAVAWAGASFPTASSQVPEGTSLVLAAVGLLTIGVGASVLLAADDLPHFVAYALVMDGGFALLALAAPGEATGAAAREWLLLNALSKTGLAVWAVALVLALRSERIDEMSGWVRRAPLLGLAFTVVVLATYGIPGWLAFSSRLTLVERSTSGLLTAIGVAVAWLGALGYLRVLLVGLRAPAPVLARGAGEGAARPVLPPAEVPPAGTRPAFGDRAILAWRSNVVPVAAVAAILVAVVPVLLSAGFGGLGQAAVDAASGATPGRGPSGSPAPLPSVAPSAGASVAPSAAPGGGASTAPGGAGSAAPGATPSASPTASRTPRPSAAPSALPTPRPTPSPTPRSSRRPTPAPSPSP